jgi:iron(II)-dependent oxidoreductase
VANERLAGWVSDAAERARDMLADLSDEQLMGPYLPTVNPMRWELGHAAWFYSYWVLRSARDLEPVRADEDALFNSVKIAHTKRWVLELPSVEDTIAYHRDVHQRVIDGLGDASERDLYLTRYSVLHEDMHCEAFTYMRQSLGYRAPLTDRVVAPDGGGLAGDVDVPGGMFRLGAEPDAEFAFDVEKWAHPVRVEPFSIARAQVSQGQFAEFVDDGGYQRDEHWTPAAWSWRQAQALEHPLYWRKVDGTWQRRHYDSWVDLEPHRAMIFVSAYEAEAYCQWAGRRLPTELEWEVAAAGEPDGAGNLGEGKRLYPWGDAFPTAAHAHLDSRSTECADVGAYAAGDSAFGCRQMIGNTWEWTASPLSGFPGFVPDMYDEYSAPWFGSHRVLRGGAWCTRSRMVFNTWRNFYTPNRNDVMVGFRTCALP